MYSEITYLFKLANVGIGYLGHLKQRFDTNDNFIEGDLVVIIIFIIVVVVERSLALH